jgi:hypothetical protein
MALKQVVKIEGSSFINTSFGQIETGVREATFSAICKVVSVQGDKERLVIDVLFKADGINYHKNYSFTPSIDENSTNFIKQAYLHLKTLEEFAVAEDC